MFIDVLETISYLNILLFCITKLFIKIEGNEQIVAAYLSGIVFFLLLLFIILYHIITEVISKTVIWRKLLNRKQANLANIDYNNHEFNDDEEVQGVPTSSVVERPSHREPLSVIDRKSVV